MVELIFLAFLNLLAFGFILDLLISHLFLELYLAFVFFFFFFFALVVGLGLLDLQPMVLLLFLPLCFLLALLLLELLVEFLLDLLLEFLLAQPLELLLLLEEFSVEFHQSGPLVVIVALDLVDRFGCD